jgi:segregation and condensation protein B
MDMLSQHIEALIFCSEESISLSEIRASLKLSYGWEPEDDVLLESIAALKEKYASDDFAFVLAEISEGYQFLTKQEYHATVTALIQHKARKRLSTAQMETLSIIAYRQPVTRTEIEHIRGVNCDYAVQKLLEKELIEIKGKSDAPGKPLVYATSSNFMDYFGIKSVKDLPQLKDIHPEENEIGVPADHAEVTVDAGVPVTETEETVVITADAEPVTDAEAVETSISDEEETVIVEGAVDPFQLPDRKSIYMEHQDDASFLEEHESPDDGGEQPYDTQAD